MVNRIRSWCFWLITRGGDVPAEVSFAVSDYYKHWKKNDQVMPF
ncbi:hypothetical protein QW180_23055 [Vibrio sinaloensis]|nr:hypothetical protein [Vibrio sinaloensis]